MHIRLAQLDELPILENLARQIWPATYADIISQEQIDFMLNWMYSFPALRQQQEEGHEFYILNHEGQDIGFIRSNGSMNHKKVKALNSKSTNFIC
jgi:hypothetical protein